MKRAFYIVLMVCFYSCEKPTEACFTSSANTAHVDSLITFNASCCQNASYYAWDFGDNSGDTQVTSVEISHRYAAAGQYTVKLDASRKDGAAGGKKDKPTVTQVITVR